MKWNGYPIRTLVVQDVEISNPWDLSTFNYAKKTIGKWYKLYYKAGIT
jgi:hypothetical protein